MNDMVKDNIENLWTDVDTSILNADQKASLKRMKRSWSLTVTKKGNLMYDIVPKDKPPVSNAQTIDGRNNNETPTTSATTNTTTADSAETNNALLDAPAETDRQSKANEKPAPTENPANIAQAEHVKKAASLHMTIKMILSTIRLVRCRTKEGKAAIFKFWKKIAL